MSSTEPTADEFSAAYKRARLRWVGVSYQRALSTPSLRCALRMGALALRAKEQQQDGKPAPVLRAQT